MLGALGEVAADVCRGLPAGERPSGPRSHAGIDLRSAAPNDCAGLPTWQPEVSIAFIQAASSERVRDLGCLVAHHEVYCGQLRQLQTMIIVYLIRRLPAERLLLVLLLRRGPQLAVCHDLLHLRLCLRAARRRGVLAIR